MNVHRRSVPTQVAVVGAGAAGLAAARKLLEHGVDVLVLEAQGRVGGRAYTLRTHDGAFPIELGAEFIHGKAPAILQLLRECGLGTIEFDAPSSIWEATQRVIDRVDVDAPDTSVDAFLRSVATPDADEARMLIEGFDAAIAADTSMIAIANEWRSDANDTQGRPADGYGVIMEHLAAAIGDRVLLKAPVTEIHRSAPGVQLYAYHNGEAITVQARAAIVTVPIGVLHEGGIRFDPPLPPHKRAAVDAIGMGPVIKVVLEFRDVFWDGSFFQTPPESGFPTLWSRMPQAAPILVAWAGGDAATRLAARRVDPVQAALDACAAVFPDVDVRARLLAAHVHDWQRDPYARGAYSYLRVNAGGARRRLAEPLDGMLYFAGEATSTSDGGTVGGALESGYRAALEVSRSTPRFVS